MPHGDVTEIKSVPPVILRVKHHALGTGVAGRFNRLFEVDFEVAFRGCVALPLHHAVGLVGWDDALSPVRLAQLSQRRKYRCRRFGPQGERLRPCRQQSF